MIREAARQFSQTFLREQVPIMEASKKISQTVVNRTFEQGFMALEVPEEYGGVGASFTDSLAVVQEISKVDPSLSLMVDIQNTLVQPMMSKYASLELKDKYWENLAQNSVGCFALSEAGSGSDAFAMKTKATQDNDHWILNGQKMWISNSDHGEYFFVFANTGDTYRDIRCFIVERDTPGLEIGKPENKLGLVASATCPLTFEDVRVSKENMLSHPGHKIAIDSLNAGRIAIGAQMVGIAQGALEATLPILHERKQFDQPLYQFQSVRHQFSELQAETCAIDALVFESARKYENNEPYLIEACSAKLLAGRLAQRVTSKCIDLVGGVGFTEDLPLAKLYRDSKIGTIYEGTDNIQLETISKQFLNK